MQEKKIKKEMTMTDKSLSSKRKPIIPRKYIVASVICLSFSSLILFIIFWCTNLFQNTILSTLIVKNGTQMLDWFIRPPIRPVYNMYIFNYTNIDDFNAGKTKILKVEEVGPYIYRETLTRVNYVFHDNGTVSFQEKRSYLWEGGRPDDEILIVPNVPLLAAMAFLRDSTFFAQLAFTGVLTTLQAKPFTTVTAGGLLWGYDDEIFELGKPIIALQEDIPIEKFGLFAHKVGLSPDVLNMNTGSVDLSRMSLLESINGKTHRNIWHDDDCDNIHGSEGYIFPYDMINDPHIRLPVYSVDMCRTLYLNNAGAGSSFGIPTITFKPVPDAFNYQRAEERCFCTKSSSNHLAPRTCPPNGLFNSSACSYNMPFAISLPHFLAGDKILFNGIEGLNPQPELHESHIEVHPRLGVVIGGNSRIQLNIQARRAVSIPFFGNLDDGQILPLVWVDVSVDSIPESLMNLLRHGYFTATTVEAGMQWGSIVGIILSSGALMQVLRKQRKVHRANLKRKISGQAKLLEESELGTVEY